MEATMDNVLTRDDTFFGVCEALGEDLRVHPNLLRLGFALGLFFNPFAAIGAYFGLGLVVAVIRWFVPNPSVAAPVQAVAEPEAAPLAREEAHAKDEMAIAA
jgi:phage shock protein C